MTRRALALLALGALCRLAHAGAPLELEAAIPLPGVAGRIDHMALDPSGRRLFVAALGNGTLEVIDLVRGRVERSLRGFAEPQGLALAPEANRLYVAEGGAGRVDALDARTLAVRARVGGLPDADNLRYDAATATVMVGYGEGAIRLIDARSGKSAGDIPLPGHPEAFELDPGGARMFVNLPGARQVAVVDRAQRRAVAAWSLPGARANFPLALDAAGRRLFVGARHPAELLVFDIDSGRVIARAPIGRDADDVFFDPARERVYVVCGEGRVDVFGSGPARRYVREASVTTAPRARTGLLARGGGRLFVAAPAAGAAPARVLVYRVQQQK